jgi:hypothetical protein
MPSEHHHHHHHYHLQAKPCPSTMAILLQQPRRRFFHCVRRLVIYMGCLVTTISFSRILLASTLTARHPFSGIGPSSSWTSDSGSDSSSSILRNVKSSSSSSLLLAAAASSSMEKYNQKSSTTTTSPLLTSSSSSSSSSLFFDNTDSSPDYAVFYNIYIPVDDESANTTADTGHRRQHGGRVVQAALDIILEQLDQVGRSWAATHARNDQRFLKVYYNTIGNANVLTRALMEEHCTRRHQIRCIHMQHYNDGTGAFEEVTLQRTREYCQVHSSSNATNNKAVIYLHSKGTFHEMDMNHHWRRSMTAAVTSQDCLQSVLQHVPPIPTKNDTDTTSSSSCNVCGLSFQPVWTTFFPGNMWTASCEYLLQLLPIHEYQTRMQQHAELVARKQQVLETSIFLPRRMKDADFLGTGRYASEHWVGSHYDLRPCDVSPTSDLTFWWRQSPPVRTTTTTNSTSTDASSNNSNISMNSTRNDSSFVKNTNDELFAWAMAPRHALTGNPWLGIPRVKNKMGKSTARQPNKIRKFLKQPLSIRTKEYTMLAGHIHKWLFLHNATPPASSWVWRFYPDAAFWQQTLNQYGDSLLQENNEDSFLDKVAWAVAQNESWVYPYLIAADHRDSLAQSQLSLSDATNTASFHSQDHERRTITTTTTSSTATTSTTVTNDSIAKSTFSFSENDHTNDTAYSSPNYTIIYNIYIPDTRKQKDIAHALKIVREQLGQVGASFAIQDALSKHQIVTIYYNTIGNKHAITDDFMHDHCSAQHGMRCIHMNHYDSAFEQVTLQKTHEYCEVNPRHRVIYLHNKGSYHSHGANNYWRRSLTAAAMSEHCLSKRQPHSGGDDDEVASPAEAANTSSCNVCALQFHPIWTNFFPGNMYIADCNYVAKLLPPAKYEKKMRSLAKDAILNHDFAIKIYNTKQMISHDFWGVERYADEHWIASHPDLVPCDVSKTSNLRFWVSQPHSPDATLALFQLDMAPRKNITGRHLWAGLNNRSAIGEVLKSDDIRMREYVLLAGILHRWFYLYNKAPAPSSWAWQWYVC